MIENLKIAKYKVIHLIFYNFILYHQVHHRNYFGKLTNIKTLWLRSHKKKFPLPANSASAK